MKRSRFLQTYILVSILIICYQAGLVRGHARSTGILPGQEQSHGRAITGVPSSQTPSPINTYFDSTTESFEEKIARSQHFDEPITYYRSDVTFTPVEPVGGYTAWRSSALHEEKNDESGNILQLGKMGGFEGPRRRRSTDENDQRVFYVYPEHYREAQKSTSSDSRSNPDAMHATQTGKDTTESRHYIDPVKISKPSGEYAAFRSSDMQNAKVEPDILLLGKQIGSFQGPRRRRLADGKERVFYVYPEHYNLNTVINEEEASSSTTTTTPSTYPSNDVSSSEEDQNHPIDTSPLQSHTQFSERSSIDLDASPTPSQAPMTLDQYLAQAILDYGHKSVPQPSSQEKNLVAQVPPESLPFLPSPTPWLPAYSVLNPYSYQWNDRISPSPAPIPPEDRPSILAPLFHRYIDFEVNNPETADLMRKLLFGFVIGTLVAAWIGLGVLFGFFPMQLLFLTKTEETSTTSSARVNEDLSKRNLLATRSELNKLTDNVYIALESNWLKELEERVKANSNGGKVALTVAKCCVLPDEQVVECKLVKVPHNKYDVGKPIKCPSDLIYNFKFGEDDDV